jgi:ABC-2 type transport system permease protein
LYSAPMIVNCDATARSELLAALAEDVANQSVEDRYHPDGECRGVVMFTQAGESAADTFAYGVENTVIYLTDEFTHTLAWFEEKGLSAYLSVGGAQASAASGKSDAASAVDAGSAEAEVAEVESLTFQRYAPYVGMNAVTDPQSAYFMGYKSTSELQFITMQDFGTKYSTDDADEIAELLPLMRNNYFLDGGGYLVSAKLKGQEAYTYLFIPMKDAPEWLVRVAGA